MMDILLLIIASIIFLIGIAGIIVPVIPSLPVIWVGAFLYAALTDFAIIDGRLLLILGIIAIVGTLLDFVANILGAKKYGATRWGVTGAAVGSLVGIFLGPLGIILGAFAGALVGEYLRDNDHSQAFKAGLGTFIGFLFGTLAKIVLSFVMIGMFFAQRF